MTGDTTLDDLPNVSLPNAALARQSDSANLPQIPDTGSGGGGA